MSKVSKKKTVKKVSAKKKTVKKVAKRSVKESAKKSPAKKKPVKKKASKNTSKKVQRPLTTRNASPDKVFVLVNGHRLKNVKELADIMEKLEDYVFEHHVTEDRNDFATWLKDVFRDIDLAKEVAGCKDKKHIQLVLYRHISHKLW